MFDFLKPLAEVFTELSPHIHFVEPAKRTYWLFWVSGILLGFIFLKWKMIPFDWRKYFFSRAYWWNASTKIDYLLMLTNQSIRLLALAPIVGSHLLASIFVARFLQHNFGNAPDWALLSGLSIALLYTLTFFLAEDFSRFFVHRCMHKVPLLWRIHRVHHSAETLTPFTLFRVHPIEMAIYYLRGVAVFAGVSGLALYLFGSKLSALEVLGVDILGFIFNACAANLRHSHLPLSFGRLEHVFISPLQHQVHHSRAPEHRDLNFGSCLACWDRWFGSHLRGDTNTKLEFGLSPVQIRTPFAVTRPVRMAHSQLQTSSR